MDQTFEEILRLATEGRTGCQIELGNAYLMGASVMGHQLPQDFVAARRWLELAHEKGATTAAFLLGIIYEEGKGVSADIPRAIALYERAGERGAYLACIRVARIYAQQARKWYEKALSSEQEVGETDGIAEARAFLERGSKHYLEDRG